MGFAVKAKVTSAGSLQAALDKWPHMPRSREGSIVRTKLEEAQLWLGHLARAGVE